MTDKLTKYQIKKEIAVLSTSGKKSMRFNLSSWNDGPDTYEIRLYFDSQPEGLLPGKGLLLNEQEVRNLYAALQELFAEDPDGLG